MTATTTKRPKGKVGKVVRFAPRHLIKIVPRVVDLLPPGLSVDDLWYNDVDYSQIKVSMACILFRMENGVVLDDVCHSSRGLESHTSKQSCIRQATIHSALHAVLDEQDRQWKVNRDNCKAISRVYSCFTAPCALAARQRGEHDARDARAICHDILHRRHVRRRKSMGHASMTFTTLHRPPLPRRQSIGTTPTLSPAAAAPKRVSKPMPSLRRPLSPGHDLARPRVSSPKPVSPVTPKRQPVGRPPRSPVKVVPPPKRPSPRG